MDFKFTRGQNSQPTAIFDMGGETLGAWFTDELSDNQPKISKLMKVIRQLEQKEITSYKLKGSEYDLHLNAEEVEIMSHRLDIEAPKELPEGMALYDQESISGCGLEDFKNILLSWTEFITG